VIASGHSGAIAQSNPWWCGDGTCQIAECLAGFTSGDGCEETYDNCSQDCVIINWPDEPPATDCPNDGIDWCADNPPPTSDEESCHGNCGRGCTKWSICGSPGHKWTLEITSTPQYSDWEGYTCQGNDLVWGSFRNYTATGRWTYWGWSAAGCDVHDDTCGPWYLSPFCYSFTSFLMGACIGAGPESWEHYKNVAHQQTLYAEVVQPMGCYAGPPTCGDFVCQSYPCDPEQTPGSGCYENSSTCPTDCSS
jgi:hypothetical protein